VLDVIERGLWNLGEWEQNCIAAAIVQIHAGKHQSAHDFALKALWPAEKRSDAKAVHVHGALDLTVNDLKAQIEFAREPEVVKA
jgi:hypothetical protein